MAASGIQEHNEARRKEAFIMRRAHLRKSNSEYGGISQSRDEMAVGRIRGVEVPEKQWWREQLLGAHGHHRAPQSGYKDIHMSRVEQHGIQYSAKLPNRYNNIDYTSQW